MYKFSALITSSFHQQLLNLLIVPQKAWVNSKELVLYLIAQIGFVNLVGKQELS